MIGNVKKIIIRPDFLSQQIYCSNGAFSFLNETSPEELVSRPLPANALCIPTVHHFIRYMHVHICEQKISFFFFSARKKNCHRHVNRFGDVPFISLLCNRAKAWKRYFALNLNLRRWEHLSLLDYKHKDITAKHQDERIASSTYRNYSCNFAGSTHFYFAKAGGRKMGLGGGRWKLTVRL